MKHGSLDGSGMSKGWVEGMLSTWDVRRGSQYRQMEGARFCSGWIPIRNPNQNTVMYCIAKFPSTTDYVHDGGPLT
jgi:hypothetical protein